MLVIGLTGGIGAGKSTIAGIFRAQGIPIIDTDEIAREVVAPGQPALEQIAQHFGSHMLLPDGSLNRKTLGEHIFKNALARNWLEYLLHPLIRDEATKRINALNTPYCIVMIPLLAETKPNPIIQRVLVVDSPEDLQITRAMKRDHISAEHVRHIMQSQASREKRLNVADDVIINDSDVEHLQQQVLALHKKYLALANK